MRRYIKKNILFRIEKIEKLMEQAETALIHKIDVDYNAAFPQICTETLI